MSTDLVPELGLGLKMVQEQLSSMATKMDAQKFSKAGSLTKAAPSVLGAVFTKVSSVLTVLWTLFGPALKNELGMVDANLQPLMKLLKEVKQLQIQTLDAVNDLTSLVKGLDATEAQERLDGFIIDIGKLAKYDPNSKGFQAEQQRIKKKIQDVALEDLRSIHNDLFGRADGLNLERQGLLQEVYDRKYRNFERDGSYTIQKFAKALDTYLCAAVHCQLTYFLLWSSTCHTQAEIDVQKIEAEVFAENLMAQEAKFVSMRPLSVDFFVRDPTSVSADRRYYIHNTLNDNQVLTDVVFIPKLGPNLSCHQYEWDTKDLNSISNDERNSLSHWNVGNRFKLEESDYSKYPVTSTLESYLGVGAESVKLENPLIYYGSGFVGLNQEDNTWAGTRSIPVYHIAPNADRASHMRLQIVPLDEKKLGKDGKVCISLRDTSEERGFVKAVYKGSSSTLWLEDLGVGGRNEPRKDAPEESSCVIM